MKVDRTETVPATTRHVVDHYICDLCGAKTEINGRWPGRFGNASETTIEMKQGDNWGTDGGSVTVTAFDVCMRCFTCKLVPWFAEAGARPRTTQQDW